VTPTFTILWLGGHDAGGNAFMAVITGAGFTALVVTPARLLAGFGSAVAELTVAPNERTPDAGTGHATATVTEMIAFSPLAIVPLVQLMVPDAPAAGAVQVHPAGRLAAVRVVDAGRLCVITALAAEPGPLLVAVTVYVSLAPPVPLAGADTMTARSAAGGSTPTYRSPAVAVRTVPRSSVAVTVAMLMY
jgi:hypothetical protein